MSKVKEELFRKLLFRLELFHSPEEHKNKLVSDFINANKLPFTTTAVTENVQTYFDNYKKTIELLKSGNPCDICALIEDSRKEISL